MDKNSLIERLHNKSAIVGIIGLGYVGLPLALRFSKVGYKVIGIDIDEEKVNCLNQGKSYLEHIAEERVKTAVEYHLQASCDFSNASECDALILCVPTPLTKCREPDLSYILKTIESILPHIRPGHVISLESTTYPGTTEEVLKVRLESTGYKVGKDIFLVYSPEREDPGNPEYVTATIPKVCGGSTPQCLEAGIALYDNVINKVVPVSSTQTAEMTKLLENIHRSVNIGLVNEMKIIADKMGIDIHEVIHAASTKPFGFVPYYPGPGIGGHCIPIDPFYLTWKAREYGIHTRFIELAGEVNSAMPAWVVGKVMEALNARKKALNGSRILVLGLAYKKNIADVRESPAVEILELLHEKGADVSYSDPHVLKFPMMREHDFDLESVPVTPENLSACDCVILATAHHGFDFDLIREHSPLLVDTRGVYLDEEPHIVKA